MHDAFGVCGLKRVGKLHAEGQQRFDVERTTTDAISERLAVQQLHDDKMLRLVLLDAVNRADVRMIQSRRRARLSLEALQQIFVAGQRRCQKLCNSL